MNTLHHQTPICLLNYSELSKGGVYPMGCISMPVSFVVQTPTLGVVSNVRGKKKQAWGLVSKRRHSFTINALSATRVEDNMVVKEDAEFKSSFNEHLEAMELVRANREKKKNVHKGSDPGKKRIDAYGKDAPRIQKRGDKAVKSRWVKSLDSKVDNRSSARSDGVANKKKFGGSIQTRSSVRSEKRLSYVRSKNGLSNTVDVHAADSKSFELVKMEMKSMNETSVDDNLETGNIVRSEKKLSYVGSKNGINKKVDVPAAASKSSELVKKKINSMNEMSVDDDLKTRNSVRSEKKLSYVGSNNGLRKKVYVRAAASKNSELAKKNIKSMNEMSVDDGLETRNNVRSENKLSYVGPKSGLSNRVYVRAAASKNSEPVKNKIKCMNEVSVEDDLVTRNSVRSGKKLSYVGSTNGLSKKVYVRAAASKCSELVNKKVKSMTEMSVDDDLNTRSSVRSGKLSYVGSKNGLSKKVYVRTAASKKPELVKKKINSMNEMSVDNDLETRNSVRSEKELSYVGSNNGLSKKVYVRAGASKSSELVNKKIKSMTEMSVDDDLNTRNSVRSEKKLSYIGSKNGLSKNVYVRTAASKKPELVKKKIKSMNEMSVDNDLETRNSVRSEKELSCVGSKNGLSKKLDVRAAAFKSSELVKKKIKPMNEMSVDDDLEMDRFIFQSSDDGLDVPGVSQMEMEERIQKLAISLNNADMNMPQWMFAKTMRSARIRFSDHSMLRIIQILGKFHNWQRVLQVIEWLQMQERFKSRKIRYVYTAALDVVGKAKRPVEALNLFYAMQRHSSTYPDIVTYHSIAITLGQAGHMKELFDVIDSMRIMPKNFKIDVLDDWDPRLEPDVVIYNAVLNGCVKRKEWEGAVWVLRKLEESGQQPSSTTYGLAMEVMLACGKYDLVHEYFKLVQRSSVPNALTYRVVINTLWREGKADEAIAAVQDMESRGLIGSASLYYDLARCLCSVGRCDEGLKQVDRICTVASKPLVVTYTGLIQACVANGKIHDATSIFNLMQKHCSPNTVTGNIMLKGYLGYGMFDEANDLFQKMIHSEHKSSKVRNRIRPDLHTFNLMLEAYIQGKRWDDFEYAYEQMLQHRHPFNTKRHLWMVLQASGAGKVETVEITWSHLMETNRVPPPGLVKERFRLKMADNNFDEAVSSVARHPSTRQQSFSKESWLQLLKDNAHSFKKEALEHLIQEVKKSLSTSESRNLIYQNLLDSCMEFVRHDILVTSTA